MANTSNYDIARAIYSLSKDKSESEQRLILPKVVRFLAKRRLLSQKEDILSKLGKIVDQDSGTIRVDVSSAEKLNEKTRSHLSQVLTKRYSASKTVLNEKVDDKLLGGFKLTIDDEVIDLTLKNKIRKLQEHLTRNHG